MAESIFSLMRSVAAISVISMLLEYLMPGRTFHSSIRTVTGLVFLSVIVKPIIQIFGSFA